MIGVPAATLAVSCKAPELPSSLQARVGSVASVIGLLIVRPSLDDTQDILDPYILTRSSTGAGSSFDQRDYRELM